MTENPPKASKYQYNTNTKNNQQQPAKKLNFVNYDNNYVNNIMSTKHANPCKKQVR